MSQSPAEWLRLQPRGAYTTLLVRGACHELVDWPTHLERLVLSLRAMHKALGIYSQFYSWLAVSRRCTALHCVPSSVPEHPHCLQ